MYDNNKSKPNYAIVSLFRVVHYFSGLKSGILVTQSPKYLQLEGITNQSPLVYTVAPCQSMGCQHTLIVVFHSHLSIINTYNKFFWWWCEEDHELITKTLVHPDCLCWTRLMDFKSFDKILQRTIFFNFLMYFHMIQLYLVFLFKSSWRY